jgi:indolepyruvate ferredoxin oxidoreductase, alpha subunit
MQRLLLLGDEALAQGAIDAGLSGVYAYPGTPSTEITEYIQASAQATELGIHSKWSTNEKTAMESGLGMAYTGKRSLVCMKHVGLNVAADAFMNASITGVNGGLIVVSADDPSMHSSQNEQDSRYYGKFALIPIFEPATQQETYDMVHAAYDLSEKYKVPVMMRVTTRLAHSRSGVERKPAVRPQNQLATPADPTQFVLLPNLARKRYKLLLSNQEAFEQESNNSPFNKYFDGDNKKLGIIACGIAYNYLMECYKGLPCPYPVVKVAQYPLPEKHLAKLEAECDALLVLEEGYPLVEESLKGYFAKGKKIHGRLDGTLPRDGELNPDLVAAALGLKTKSGEEIPSLVANRPPMFCQGCSHIDVFTALIEALKPYSPGRVFADIGCYTLGALPPFSAINSCVDMGASITMAKGAADAGLVPSVAVIGDSTFTHSGITGLLDAVNDNSPITIIISDNEATAMTGGQESAAEGKIEQICAGIGVAPEHIRVMTPLPKTREELIAIIKEELEYPGVSVIIPRRVCIQKAARTRKAKQ